MNKNMPIWIIGISAISWLNKLIKEVTPKYCVCKEQLRLYCVSPEGIGTSARVFVTYQKVPESLCQLGGISWQCWGSRHSSTSWQSEAVQQSRGAGQNTLVMSTSFIERFWVPKRWSKCYNYYKYILYFKVHLCLV